MHLFFFYKLILMINIIIFFCFQGFYVSTLSQVLTPEERVMYVFFNILPDRIYNYNGCLAVKGQTGYYKNDLRKKNGKPYKYIPRVQYYMEEFTPESLIKSGIDIAEIGKKLVFGGDLDSEDDDDDDDADGAQGDNVDADKGDDTAGATDNDADGATDNNADGATNHGKNIEEEPGLLTKALDMANDLMKPLFNFFGDSEDANIKNDGEKKDDINDKKDENKDNTESVKPEDSTSYAGMFQNMLESDAVKMAKDAMQSDLAKEAAMAGISMIVPGGPAIVAAMEAASKYQKADDAVDKVGDKLHI